MMSVNHEQKCFQLSFELSVADVMSHLRQVIKGVVCTWDNPCPVGCLLIDEGGGRCRRPTRQHEKGWTVDRILFSFQRGSGNGMRCLISYEELIHTSNAKTEW